jgi:predicted RNase H-like HicB family nuclease
MASKYQMIICWSEEERAYIAKVPELSECVANGSSYQEVVSNAEKAIAEWIANANELGRKIPTPKRCSPEIKTTKRFNGWGSHIIQSFFPPVRYLSKVFSERFLPSFNDLNTEAELTCQSYESEHAIVEYISLYDVRQGMINLHAVGLRHLFEQQFCYLVSRLLDERNREANYKKDEKILVQIGEINIESFRSWNKLKELECVCNAVKHAEGYSARKLEGIRPDLFKNPILFEFPNINFGRERLPIHRPLEGDDIYLQETDIKQYALAIEDFWNEFIEKLSSRSNHE